MTDRTIRSVADLDSLDFGKSEGLVPIVVQDARTGETLMLAYANRDALEASLSSGEMHFWSRSRDELWRKGETSGNTLQIRSLHADCDADSVLALVVPAGPAEAIAEAADLVYHMLVALRAEGATLADVAAELAQRAK